MKKMENLVDIFSFITLSSKLFLVLISSPLIGILGIASVRQMRPCLYSNWHSIIIPTASTKLKAVYTGFTLSVCPSVDKIVSALYLQLYSSDPFHVSTSYLATSECDSLVTFVLKFRNFKIWQILQICNFDCVFFWLWIQYDSIVWVTIRLRGYPQNASVLVVLVWEQ